MQNQNYKEIKERFSSRLTKVQGGGQQITKQ